jgi:twinkle protein
MNFNTFNEVDFERYMLEADPVSKVLPADAWRNELQELLANGNQLQGATLPWQKTHDQVRFRGSEVTLWQGINGHGKSQLLGMACLWFMKQGERVCIASFEMKPQHTIMRMLRQAAMTDKPSPDFANEVLDWCEDKLWIYDHLGSVEAQRIFAAIKYAHAELGVKHFVIDNLMKCVKNEDDYSGQKAFIDRICSLARECDMHIHVVHHVRKGQTEDAVPTKFDSRGSGTIADQVDQILTVWRNKKKEETLRKEPENKEWQQKCDALLVCDKNRHGDWEGKIALWHHRQSLQYTPDDRTKPLNVFSGGEFL